MNKQEFSFSFEVYNGIEDLSPSDAELLQTARQTTAYAYAPYSHFHVGAAARMLNGEVVTGTNQENASFPAGLCAERVLLASAASVHPGEPIITIAISYDNKNGGDSNYPIAPCGICRQALQEFELRTNSEIRMILGGKEGQVYVLQSASLLLPLAFTKNDLSKL